jgi:hypothetical protein
MAELSTHRGERIDETHYAVQLWDHQQLTQATLFYQFRQIPSSVRRDCKSFAFTGRVWRDEENCRMAEVAIEMRPDDED